ncbi:hypothetical protein HK097_002644 [Rhizophlyctis rosea]|uniref:Uncharacterized protein n=1 Tax=Rhizophlyctis rosea TaxID=64517 RepID=A0AAD5X015_9FUNG|nr:hypothetical protein HK097_002644 [Rhizophlyctis rosea]
MVSAALIRATVEELNATATPQEVWDTFSLNPSKPDNLVIVLPPSCDENPNKKKGNRALMKKRTDSRNLFITTMINRDPTAQVLTTDCFITITRMLSEIEKRRLIAEDMQRLQQERRDNRRETSSVGSVTRRLEAGMRMPATAGDGATSNSVMKEYKLVVLGSGGVGKSTLTVQFVQSRFVETNEVSNEDIYWKRASSHATIEDSYRKQVRVDGQQCMLEILDTAGTEIHGHARPIHEEREGFILVYNVTDDVSFNDLIEIREEILRVKDTDKVPMVLVGNKCDLEDDRVVTREQGKGLASQWDDCTSFETSATDTLGVKEVFFELVRLINMIQTPSKRVLQRNPSEADQTGVPSQGVLQQYNAVLVGPGGARPRHLRLVHQAQPVLYAPYPAPIAPAAHPFAPETIIAGAQVVYGPTVEHQQQQYGYAQSPYPWQQGYFAAPPGHAPGGWYNQPAQVAGGDGASQPKTTKPAAGGAGAPPGLAKPTSATTQADKTAAGADQSAQGPSPPSPGLVPQQQTVPVVNTDGEAKHTTDGVTGRVIQELIAAVKGGGAPEQTDCVI